MNTQTIGASGLLDPQMPLDQLLLAMGEMSLTEVAAARGALAWANAAIRRAKEAETDDISTGVLSPDISASKIRAKLGSDLGPHEILTVRSAIGWANRTAQAGAGPEAALPYQGRVSPWLLACFGERDATDVTVRNHRFLEEALELVQSLGCTRSEAMQLTDYVFGREIGEPTQEVGGVMVNLAGICAANGLDMNAAGETELARVWTKVEKIRAKHKAKPPHSPLPAQHETIGTSLILAAIEPVLHWYQSDEVPNRPLPDILRDIVADLQEDRAAALKAHAASLQGEVA